MFPNKPKYHQILPFFWFLFVFESYVILKSRTIEWVKKSSLQYPSEESAASSPGLFPFSKGKPWERGWGVEILDIFGTERGSSSVSRLCLIWIQLFQRCHDGQLNSLTHCKAYFYDVASLRSWRYCVGARLKFWRRSRVPKKGRRDEAVEMYFSRLRRSWRLRRQISLDYITTAPPPNLTRLLHNTASYAGYDVASSGWLGCCLVFSWCFRCDSMRRRAGSLPSYMISIYVPGQQSK